MKKIIVLITSMILLSLPLSGKVEINKGDSIVEYPVIVIVGQVVEVTPFSVIFENTFQGTDVTDEQILKLKETFYMNSDFRAHGFANALQVVSVKNGKMRTSFYLDNILKVFDDDVRTYMKYIPLYYMFKNNIKSMRLPDGFVDELKKQPFENHLETPFIKELMNKSWLAGVFRVSPETGKLIYQSSRFFNNIDELMTDEWAREYRIPSIVKNGMTVTISKAVVVGKESKQSVPEKTDKKEPGVKSKTKGYNKPGYDTSGREKK